MKKYLLITGLLCIAFFSKAQMGKVKSYLWANGGVNYASLYENSDFAQEVGGIIGPEGGLSLRVQYPTYWGFEVGGYYSMKGAKFEDADTKVTLNYVGAFVNGLLFFPLKNYDDIYVGGGIYALQAYDGKSKYDTTTLKISFGDTWKRFDGGLQLRAAYVIKNTVSLGLHYDIGAFRNFNSTDLRGDPFNGRNSSITLFASIRLTKFFFKFLE